ncbi:IS110 family transposase [Serratia marcescens]|uniref:IS110 family transposase n=1 Tax=Serratia marcescens TaxID=615 RepID=UPI003A8ACCBB
MKTFIGIDIAKNKFDVALLRDEKYFSKVFSNTLTGFNEFLTWLDKHTTYNLHACLEATGDYGTALATFLFEENIKVSVINPAQIKGFAKSELTRTKNDKTDAKIIARFCRAITPPAWQPLPEPVRQLQSLSRRLDALNEMLRMELNRFEGANVVTRDSLDKTIAFLKEEIRFVRKKISVHIDENPTLREKKELLKTIPGIGDATITQILSFIVGRDFKKAKEVAAYLGLNPQQHESGHSVKGKTRLSKTGDSRLRAAFYMPAIVSMRYNPVIQQFSQRLIAAGKPKMLVVGAVMRKLVHIVYGVLKSGQVFRAELT